MPHSVQLDFQADEVLFYGEEPADGAHYSYRPADISEMRSDIAALQAAGPGGGGDFVSVAEFSAVPGAGDMTTQIQAAFDGAPDGSTLFFPPGVYPISDTVSLTRNLDVYGYGATLDLGAAVPSVTQPYGLPDTYVNQIQSGRDYTDVRAAVFWGADVSSGAQVSQHTFRGLNVIRTAADTSWTSRKYVGFYLLAPFECRFLDCRAENFLGGLFITGWSGRTSTPVVTAKGAVHNSFHSFHSRNCRYPITLYAPQDVNGSGWANSNTFYDGRLQIDSAIQADPTFNRNAWELFRCLRNTTTSVGGPNNNVLVNTSLEATSGVKARLEGAHNVLVGCRWENLGATRLTENVQDPGFDNPAVWVPAGVVPPVVAASKLSWTPTASGETGVLAQNTGDLAFPITPDREYELTYDVLAASAFVTVTMAAGAPANQNTDLDVATTGTKTVKFIANQTVSGVLLLFSTVGAATLEIDNFSIKQINRAIYIGDGSLTSGNFSYNEIIGGSNLGDVAALDLVRYWSSTSEAVNAVELVGGRANLHSGRVNAGDVHLTAHRFHTGHSTEATMSVLSPLADEERIKFYSQNVDEDLLTTEAGFRFKYSESGNTRENYLGISRTTDRLHVHKGFTVNVGADALGDFRVRNAADTADLLFADVNADTVTVNGTLSATTFQLGDPLVVDNIQGSTGVNPNKMYSNSQNVLDQSAWMMYNTSSGAKPILAFGDASGTLPGWLRIRSVSGDTGGINYGLFASGYLGELSWQDDNSPYGSKNALAMRSATPFYLAAYSGLYANRGQLSTGDSGIMGQTNVNLLATDASEDRVGIGKFPAQGTLDIQGDAYLTGSLFVNKASSPAYDLFEVNIPQEQVVIRGNGLTLEGDFGHMGSTLGFYNSTPAPKVTPYSMTHSGLTKANPAMIAQTLTNSTGGSFDTTLQAVSGTGDDATINNNFSDIIVQYNSLHTDVLIIKGLLNQIITDMQTYGLF